MQMKRLSFQHILKRLAKRSKNAPSLKFLALDAELFEILVRTVRELSG